mmetsp:Transcript_28888/g.43622  ORF Transcript_28888/g.43622 Transcript_28888/m.43622 type:complete len:424 (-) Transcript_28888:152-1423(-)|eukprot:CAMPEP_0178910482 /NCGR_PEP_ID=MMETSP0786-20121207/9121_1 /TAXON_ID=186022 /ORGANISM="Thalassionema frauenfeldii, Strain CCMP 1798" /LENGTH=423 /DNA_ID=CAMNT_0020582737 /DNA_START=26 /DNA_END=1297 /DNA_ORIENTATION=-
MSRTQSSQTNTFRRIVSWFLPLLVLVGAIVFRLVFVVPQPELEDLRPHALEYMKHYFPTQSLDSQSPPLQGFVVAVTGCTSGIGLGIVRKLYSEVLGANSTIIAISRSHKKLEKLKKELLSQQNNAKESAADVNHVAIDLVVADFTDLTSVAKASEQILSKYERVDFLLNNAGLHTGMPGMFHFQDTEQGYEITFGVNYLAHFLLTERLLPLLQKSQHPKVIQISSRFHFGVDGSDLKNENMDGSLTAAQPGGSHGFFIFRTQRQYANSKLAQILHARSLQRKYGIEAVSVCPTWVGTQIVASSESVMHSIFSMLAFPLDGFGLSSVFHAMLDVSSVDNSDPTTRKDFYVNSVMECSELLIKFLPYSILPVRDFFIQASSIMALLTQRLRPIREAQPSSPESYDEHLQDVLYKWSHNAVSKWL